MAKTGIPREPKIYISLFIVFLILLFMMPRTGKFNYDYKKGSPWAYETLISQIDFPILKTSEQLQAERDAAGSSIVPYYKYEDGVEQEVISGVERLNFGEHADFRPHLLNTLAGIYQRGVIADAGAVNAGASKNAEGVLFVQKDKRASKIPASDVYTVSSANARIRADLKRLFPGVKVDSVLNASGVFEEIVPNLLYDRETTDLVHAEAVDYISPTQGFVTAGQLIVAKGEIVTAEIEQMLDSYRTEYENSLGYNGPRFLMWLGDRKSVV